MRTNRRGILKAFAAAPAAAMAAKATLSEQLAKSSAFENMGRIGGVTNIASAHGIPTPDADSTRLQNYLGKLKQQLLEVAAAAPAHAPDFLIASTRVDALRSVSTSFKLQMAREEVGRKEAARRKINPQDEIAHVKKQLGLLGVLFP